MTNCAPVWRPFLFLFLAISLLGCSQFKRDEFADEKDPHYLEGKRREKGFDWDGAIEAYERALQSNPNNASAHLELGILYGERKNDFATAVYHYQKHLNLFTNSPRREVVLQQIAYCKGELAKTHAVGLLNRDVQRELEKLMAANAAYKKRIEALEAELARGPRYITNTEIKYVKVPDFTQEKSRALTEPATLVDPPPQQRAEPQPQREDPPAQRAERPRPNPQQERAAAQERPRPRTGNGGTASSGRQTPAAAEARARTHTVKPGETLNVLARRYGVSAAKLRAANPGIARGTRAGQTIVIPAK